MIVLKYIFKYQINIEDENIK
jgi:hypothetical protein